MMGGMISPCRMRVRGWAWRRVEERERIERGEEPLAWLKRAALERVSCGLREILPAHSRPWHTGVAPVCEDEARRQSVPSRRAGYAERPARRLRASPGKDPRHNGKATLGDGPESLAPRTAGVQRAAPGVQRPSGPDTGGQRRWAGGRGCVQTQTPRLLIKGGPHDWHA